MRLVPRSILRGSAAALALPALGKLEAVAQPAAAEANPPWKHGPLPFRRTQVLRRTSRNSTT